MKKSWTIIVSLFLLLLSIESFVKKEVSVSFTQKTTKDIEYQIFYTKQKDEPFSEGYSIRKKVSKDWKNIQIFIPTRKIFRFRIDPGTEKGTIEISNLKINGKKLDLSKFNKSKDVSQLSFDKNKDTLTIISNNHDPYITYKDNLNISNSFTINYTILIILLCIYLTISYIIVKFIHSKRNKIDAVFIILFGVILFIPMMKISDKEKSDKENRMLAKYQPLFSNGKLNEKYGSQFDSWFNDRFNGRDFLTNIFSMTSCYLTKECQNNSAIYFKEQNIMFNKNHISSFTYSNQLLEDTLNGIKFYKKFCKKNNIKCYIEVVPEKILFENDSIFNKYKKQIGNFYTLINFIKEKSNFNIIYPFTELEKANKKAYVYFRTDHHWTDWGTYNGYTVLMNEIKKDFPTLNILPLNDFKKFSSKEVRAEYDRNFIKGQTCKSLNLPKNMCNLNIDYNYYDYNDTDLQLVKTKNKGKNFKYKKSKNNQKVMIIGNSFTENFVTFLAPSFREVKKRRCNIAVADNLNLSRWENEIYEYKPDILIILIQENYARQHLKNLNS